MAQRWYRGYGLSIRSEIALPEFAEAPARGAPDVTLRLGAEAAEAAPRMAADDEGTGFVAAPGGGHVLDLPGAGRFLVRDGREVVVSPDRHADPGLVRLYILGSVFGMVLHQRGVLVMHGATVAAGEGAAIIVGDTGAGKSTLAAGLGRAGLAVLGDDTMPVWPRGHGGFEVRPGSRVSKLWGDALDSLGVPADGLELVANRYAKFYYPNGAEPPDAPLPLGEILLLETHDGPPEVRPLGRLEALEALARHTYRPEYVALLGREAEHFRQCAELAARVPVARLMRPDSLGRAGETVALLRRRWAAGPARCRAG